MEKAKSVKGLSLVRVSQWLEEDMLSCQNKDQKYA